jgi:hypothetical protein
MIQGSINQLLSMAAIGARIGLNVESREKARKATKSTQEIAQERAEQEAEEAQRIRQQELARVREALMANAPTTYGRRDKI